MSTAGAAAAESPSLGGPLRARAHWAVLVGPASAVRPLAASVGPRAAWTEATGRVAIVAEEVTQRAGRCAAVRGQLRWSGRTWTSPATWAAQVAVAWRPPYGDPLADATGDGAAVVVDAQGRGVAAADALGLASLYLAHHAGLTIVGTRPRLVAELLATGRGGSPERDPRTAAWFAFATTPIAGATSFRDVERLPTGALVVIADGQARVRPRAPWRDAGSIAHLDPDELVDVAEEAIADHLGAAVALDDGAPVLDLTGGKDSRLVLAVALRRFGLDAFRVRTVGAPAAGDVRAAAHIAAHLGFAHESGIVLRPPIETFAQRVARFVDLTDGMHSSWMLSLPHADPAEVRISGTSGEIVRAVPLEDAWLRSPRKQDPPTTASITEYLLAGYRRGSGGFLRPAVEADLEEQVRAHLADLAARGVPPEDLLSALFLGHHAGKLGNHRLDLDPDHRVRALTDLTAARVAYALGTQARRSERIHLDLIRRASPLLAALPLLTDDWNAPGDLPPVPELAPRDELPSGAPDPARAPEKASGHSTLGLDSAKPDDQRRAFVEEVFADGDNGIWEVADRAKVAAAVAEFDQLRMKPRQQLYGLATGAVWLQRS